MAGRGDARRRPCTQERVVVLSCVRQLALLLTLQPCLSLQSFASQSHLVAGDLASTSLHASATFAQRTLGYHQGAAAGQEHMGASGGRRLLQAPPATADRFANLPPCKALLSHLGKLQPNDNPLGPDTNFTSKPDFGQISRTCLGWFSPSSPEEAVLAIEQPQPAVKLMRLLPLKPQQGRNQHFDFPSDRIRAAPNSVNVLWCDGQWLNMLLLRSYPPVQASMIFMDCRVLLPDIDRGVAKQTWYVDSGLHPPCDVRSMSVNTNVISKACSVLHATSSSKWMIR